MNNYENNEIIFEQPKKSNKSKITIVILSILVLFLLGLCVYNNYQLKQERDKQNELLKDENTSDIEKDDTNKDNNEPAETDIKQIKEKINTLFNANIDETNSIWSINTFMLSDNLTYNKKLGLILGSIDQDKYFDELCDYNPNNTIRAEAKIECMKLSGLEVKLAYKSLFGEEVTKPYVNNGDAYCWDYYYEEDKDVYDRIGGKGCGIDPGAVAFYINKTEQDNNNIFVYLNIGVLWEEENGINLYDAIYDEKSDIYNLSIKDENIVEKNYLDSFDDINNFKIDETNYKKFTNYKLTFIYDKGKFYFKEIERI